MQKIWSAAIHRERLTLRWLVFLGLLASSLGQAATSPAVPELESADSGQIAEKASERYVEQLEALYLTSDPVSALVQHLNTQFRTHAFNDSHIVDLDKPGSLVYELNVDDGQQLRIRRSDYANDDSVSHSSDTYDLSGVNPYVSYECAQKERKCWIVDPFDAASVWLTVGHDPESTRDIAYAMAELIKRLQRTVRPG